jgi:hypothetical protein
MLSLEAKAKGAVSVAANLLRAAYELPQEKPAGRLSVNDSWSHRPARVWSGDTEEEHQRAVRLLATPPVEEPVRLASCFGCCACEPGEWFHIPVCDGSGLVPWEEGDHERDHERQENPNVLLDALEKP